MEVGIVTGSGVLVHEKGFIVTAAHVVEEAELVEVEFKDGSSSRASIVTLSRTEDLALLAAETLPKKPYVAPLADSDALKPGQRVFAIGAPLGLEHTLTVGVVSALRTNPPGGLVPHKLVQTDVAVNQGNSGGPLFTENGEVAGIVSFIMSTSGGSVGLNFAVPSNTVRTRLFEQALPWIGVSLRFMPKEVAEIFNWPLQGAFLVEKVQEGGAADKAGLQGGMVRADVGGNDVWLGGDLITKVGDVDADDPAKVGKYLKGLKPGDTIRYEVLRKGKKAVVEVPVPDSPKVPVLAAPPRK
jgi:serine protease Do